MLGCCRNKYDVPATAVLQVALLLGLPSAPAARQSMMTDRPWPETGGPRLSLVDATPADGDAAATLSSHLQAHCFSEEMKAELELGWEFDGEPSSRAMDGRVRTLN